MYASMAYSVAMSILFLLWTMNVCKNNIYNTELPYKICKKLLQFKPASNLS